MAGTRCGRGGFHRAHVRRRGQALLDGRWHPVARLNLLPKRALATPAERATALAGIEALLIAAPERPLLRLQQAPE